MSTCHLLGLAAADCESIITLCSRDEFHFARTDEVRDLLESPSLHYVGCVVLSVHQCEETARRLQQARSPWALIGLIHRHYVPDAVRAMKCGADDVLVWPEENLRLPPALHKALARSERDRIQFDRENEAHRHLSTLTAKEWDVLNLMLAGAPNKAIGPQLGIALRTVEARRGNIFKKLQTRSLSSIAAAVALLNHETPRRIDARHEPPTGTPRFTTLMSRTLQFNSQVKS